MAPLGWLLGLILPACGAFGASGVPVPPPLDVMHIERPASPNTALAAPAGFRPPPDVVVAPYAVSQQQLYAAVQSVAGEQQRTFLAAEYKDQLQVHYVVRSAVFNFPDLVTAAVLPGEPGTETSRLVLYSRSLYGKSDFGVNQNRIKAWLVALQAALHHRPER